LGTIGHVVGMTLAPEATLVRERAVCYASLCVVANWGSGMAGPLSAEAMRASSKALEGAVFGAIESAIAAIPERKDCRCGRALEGASL
ncbi:MAG: phosphorylase family protein, partial [Methanobacteriota archaeon]